MKSQLTKHLKKIINKKYPHFRGEIALEYPPNPKMGDLAFPCFNLAKIAKKSPNQIATELNTEFQPEAGHPLGENKYIQKAQPQGPYLNLFLNKELFWKEIFNSKKSEIPAKGWSASGQNSSSPAKLKRI